MLLTLQLVYIETITSPLRHLPLSSVAVHNLYVCAQSGVEVK